MKNLTNDLIFSESHDTAVRANEKEYNRHLVAIIEFSDDAIISKSLDGTIKSWNRGSEKMFGYTKAQAVGQNISIVIPAEVLEEEKQILQKILSNEVIEHYETVRVKKNGKTFYVSLTVSPLKDLAGNITGISTIARDITSRKNYEAAIILAGKNLVIQNREKEKRAAELIVANKELVYQNDEKEKRAAELLIANNELAFQNEEKEKRAAELLIANKELAFQNNEKGKRAAELLIANGELDFQNEEKEKRAAELLIANGKLVFENHEKEKRAAELLIANEELAFQNEEKEKRAAELLIANKVLIFENKEKEKRAATLAATNKYLIKTEGQLMEVNKELESFTYSVSHDLRAPLRAIHGYSQILKSELGKNPGEEALRLMNNILINAKRMGQLIDDMLTFSRIGRKELVKMDIPMADMVTNFCNEIKNDPSNKTVEFKINHLDAARADNVTIKQVWLNLISNAVKYSKFKEHPVIEIGSEIKENEITYYVKDNGAGFDMRYVDKLFGVFQRLHSDDEFEGTGVGLAIVQRIILKHGGRVWGEGKVDEGATFYFTLNKPK